MFGAISSSLVAKKPRVSIGAAVDPVEVIAIATSMQAQGRQLLSSGLPHDAIPHLALAIQVLQEQPAEALQSSRAQAYAELGEALLAVERWSTARCNLQQSLALEPSVRTQKLLSQVDAAQRECRHACVAAVLQRAFRARHAAVPAVQAAVRLQASARGSSGRRLAQQLHTTRLAEDLGRRAVVLQAAERGRRARATRRSPARAVPAEGLQAERLLRLLREAGELTRDGAVWGRLRVGEAQLWQLQRLCADLSLGVASISEIAIAARVPPSLSQLRQQQCELRGFLFRRDASEMFYRKAYAWVDDNYLSVVAIDSITSDTGRDLVGQIAAHMPRLGKPRPQPTPRAPPEQHGLVCIERVDILRLNVYEFQVVVRTLSSPKPHTLHFRSDTWRAACES